MDDLCSTVLSLFLCQRSVDHIHVGYFWALCSALLIYLSIFSTISYCLLNQLLFSFQLVPPKTTKNFPFELIFVSFETELEHKYASHEFIPFLFYRKINLHMLHKKSHSISQEDKQRIKHLFYTSFQ